MPNRFCAICGINLGKEDPHFGMCLECYLKEHPLFELPDHFIYYHRTSASKILIKIIFKEK